MRSSHGFSKLKNKHFRIKHQNVHLFRANEPLLSVFMWGINHTINELMHVTIPVILLPNDFRASSKIKIDNHLFNKENMPSHFTVKEYCPLVFRDIRERFGIDDLDYKESLTSSLPLPDDSSSKNGAKVYLSYDKIFTIKTITPEEVARMHYFLKHYSPYIVERHGKTLLPQYLGMYRLTVDNVEHYIVVCRNVFSNHLSIHRKFNLKGYTVDREASKKEREKELPTLKDNDFIREQVKISIGYEDKEKLMDILGADVDFLTKLHLMDYSLLVGIHEVDRGEQELQSQYLDVVTGGIIPNLDIYAIPSAGTAPVNEIYFIAITDVLTQGAKTVNFCSNVYGKHCNQYARKFIEFLSKAIQ